LSSNDLLKDFEHETVADSDNLNQKLQIKSVNSARERVRTVRNTAHEQIASATPGSKSAARSGGRRVYLEVVKSYALELAPLISEHKTELWENENLLTGEWSYDTAQEEKRVVEIEPGMVSIEVNGIHELLKTEFPVPARFELTLRDSVQDQTKIVSESWQPSFSEIDEIVYELDCSRQSCNLYLESPDESGYKSDKAYPADYE
jgi:hypothetical protein